MNIVLYGVSETVTERMAERYGLKRINTIEEIGKSGALLSIPPMQDPRRLLALYNAMTLREDRIDAVIVCGFAACETARTVQYCAPQGKFFTLNSDAGEEVLEEELSRIVGTLSGALCAHEGI